MIPRDRTRAIGDRPDFEQPPRRALPSRELPGRPGHAAARLLHIPREPRHSSPTRRPRLPGPGPPARARLPGPLPAPAMAVRLAPGSPDGRPAPPPAPRLAPRRSVSATGAWEHEVAIWPRRAPRRPPTTP